MNLFRRGCSVSSRYFNRGMGWGTYAFIAFDIDAMHVCFLLIQLICKQFKHRNVYLYYFLTQFHLWDASQAFLICDMIKGNESHKDFQFGIFATYF